MTVLSNQRPFIGLEFVQLRFLEATSTRFQSFVRQGLNDRSGITENVDGRGAASIIVGSIECLNEKKMKTLRDALAVLLSW